MLWFKKKTHTNPLPHEREIKEAREATHSTIDDLNAKFDELNKALEARGDSAFNLFVATGGLRRAKKEKTS